jgi:hypothetical protein
VNRAVTLQGLECQLVLVPLAQQHAERPLPIPALPRRRREPPTEQRQRAAALVVGGLGGARDVDRGVGHLEGRVGRFDGELAVDQLALHPARLQAAPDPLRAPLLERTLVLHEQPGEPLIVEHPELDQLFDRGIDGFRLDAAVEQVRANLGDRSLAPVEVPVGERERSLERVALGLAGLELLRLELLRLCSYAARPSTDSTADKGGSWRPSIGFTRSRSIPSAA